MVECFMMSSPARLASLVVALLSVLAGGGCASEQQAVRWGDETSTMASETVAEASSSATMSAEDYAKRFPTDDGCEAEARRLATGKTAALAQKLIVACIDRGDFRRLEGLTKAPWTAALRGGAAGAALCAKVVAARAGDVDGDVRACTAAGFAVLSLEQALLDRKKGSSVIVRTRDDSGRTTGTLRTEEVAYVEGELESQPTTRRLLLTLTGVPLRRDGDSIVLGQVLSIGDDEDGEPVVRLKVQHVYRAATSPTL